MRKEREIQLKVGLFVSLGVGLIMVAILVLGGPNSLFTRQAKYSSHFNSVEGLIVGAKVVLSGLQVGTVDRVDFDQQTRDIRVEYIVNRKYLDWIRADSRSEITTQGVLGDKYISLSTGTPENPPLPPDSEIPARPTKDLGQFLSKSDQLLASINSVAQSIDRILKQFEYAGRSEKVFENLAVTSRNLSLTTAKLHQEIDGMNLKAASKNLNSILEKINNGTGTLGALINDPGLYYDAKALMGGANQNRILRNLVRKTIREGEEKEGAEQPKKK